MNGARVGGNSGNECLLSKRSVATRRAAGERSSIWGVSRKPGEKTEMNSFPNWSGQIRGEGQQGEKRVLIFQRRGGVVKSVGGKREAGGSQKE